VLLKHPGTGLAGGGVGGVMTTVPLPRWHHAQAAGFPGTVLSVFVCLLAVGGDPNATLHGAGEWGEATPEPWHEALLTHVGALPDPAKLFPWQFWQIPNPVEGPGAALAEAPWLSGLLHPAGWKPAGAGEWQLWQNGCAMCPKLLLVSWHRTQTAVTAFRVSRGPNVVCPVICPWTNGEPGGIRPPSSVKWQSRQLYSAGVPGSWHASHARFLTVTLSLNAVPWKFALVLFSQSSGWNAGPAGWQTTPLREALKQETFEIPPRRSSPWHSVQTFPSGRA